MLKRLMTLMFGASMATANPAAPMEPMKEKKPMSFTIIDVRSADEFAGGHIDGAINIEHTRIKAEIAKAVADKNRRLYVYCRSGGRAGMARAELLKLGYTDVHNAVNGDGMKKILASQSK